ELGSYDNVRRAAWLAMLAGADVVKTSTGKVSPAATLPVTLILLEAVRDWFVLTGPVVAAKPAGGIRTAGRDGAPGAGAGVGVKPAAGIRPAKDAVRHLVLVNETAGPDWLDPDRFRRGAASLPNDFLLQRRWTAIRAYAGPDHLTPAL